MQNKLYKDISCILNDINESYQELDDCDTFLDTSNGAVDEVIKQIAKYFKQNDPNFDFIKFVSACDHNAFGFTEYS